ncbi:MAG: (2Fe-2S)-binding protein, partial [Bacillota bacterium]|nr:(2Fe-2S)-binding protein [Bacillota bacterium]
NPDYGKIICRCLNISLVEIKDSINRECGAKTIKGVKMRCGPGMGRCQGSFCESEVFKILEKELNVDAKTIKQNKDSSEVVSSFVKEDL